MDKHIEKPTEITTSEAGVPFTERRTDIICNLGNTRSDLAQLDSKVRHGNETSASSPSASMSPVSSNFLSSRARTAVWRQKVHSGVGAPVLAGQRILEFPSPSLATHISAVVPGQRVLHETSRREPISPLPGTLHVAYQSLSPASGLMSQVPGIHLRSPGLSSIPANLPLYSLGLPLSSAGQRRIPSNSTTATGCLIPRHPTNESRLASRASQVNGNSLRARSGHMCHSSRQSCSQYCLQGYKYCLWHILEDSLAPYKQCDFVEFPTRDRCRFPVSLKSENIRCVSVYVLPFLVYIILARNLYLSSLGLSLFWIYLDGTFHSVNRFSCISHDTNIGRIQGGSFVRYYDFVD